MKRKLINRSAVIGSLIWIFLCLTSCEKHDGVGYYYSKCEADLNGQYFIDQSRVDWGLGGRSPHIIASEYEIDFESKLSTERGGFPLYYVYIDMFVEKPWAFQREPQTIRYVQPEETEGVQTQWDYTRYCACNKINYAKIFISTTSETEIVKEGSFQITEYDKEKSTYKGNYELQFIEGTLKRDFTDY